LTTHLIDERRLQTRLKVARNVVLRLSGNDVGPVSWTPFQALRGLHTYLQNLKLGDQRVIPLQNLSLLSIIGEDGGEIMKKAHFTLHDVCRSLFGGIVADGGKTMRKAYSTLGNVCSSFRSRTGALANTEQQSEAGVWRPPIPAELKDPNSRARRDIDAMFEEVAILMDEIKPGPNSELSLFVFFLDYCC
jgi:hypothetical protein